MITHEEARIKAFSIKLESRIEDFSNHYDSVRVIVEYIAQQEKKDELLGLYRNLSMETDVIERSKYWKQINKIELEELE